MSGLVEDYKRKILYPVLDKEYTTGKMSKRRMLDLVMTLQDAYDADRLKVVADELVKRLTFNEKVSTPYWVIYEDNSLSPLTSDNFSFLLKNKAAFEKNVGRNESKSKDCIGYSGMLYWLCWPVLRKRKTWLGWM